MMTLTLAAVRQVQEDAVAFIGSALWRGRWVMRVSVSSVATTMAEADVTVDAVVDAGAGPGSSILKGGRGSAGAAGGVGQEELARRRAHHCPSLAGKGGLLAWLVAPLHMPVEVLRVEIDRQGEIAVGVALGLVVEMG